MLEEISSNFCCSNGHIVFCYYLIKYLILKSQYHEFFVIFIFCLIKKNPAFFQFIVNCFEFYTIYELFDFYQKNIITNFTLFIVKLKKIFFYYKYLTILRGYTHLAVFFIKELNTSLTFSFKNS